MKLKKKNIFGTTTSDLELLCIVKILRHGCCLLLPLFEKKFKSSYICIDNILDMILTSETHQIHHKNKKDDRFGIRNIKANEGAI